jgi:hypothetical protein
MLWALPSPSPPWAMAPGAARQARRPPHRSSGRGASAGRIAPGSTFAAPNPQQGAMRRAGRSRAGRRVGQARRAHPAQGDAQVGFHALRSFPLFWAGAPRRLVPSSQLSIQRARQLPVCSRGGAAARRRRPHLSERAARTAGCDRQPGAGSSGQRRQASGRAAPLPCAGCGWGGAGRHWPRVSGSKSLCIASNAARSWYTHRRCVGAGASAPLVGSKRAHTVAGTPPHSQHSPHVQPPPHTIPTHPTRGPPCGTTAPRAGWAPGRWCRRGHSSRPAEPRRPGPGRGWRASACR